MSYTRQKRPLEDDVLNESRKRTLLHNFVFPFKKEDEDISIEYSEGGDSDAEEESEEEVKEDIAGVLSTLFEKTKKMRAEGSCIEPLFWEALESNQFILQSKEKKKEALSTFSATLGYLVELEEFHKKAIEAFAEMPTKMYNRFMSCAEKTNSSASMKIIEACADNVYACM